MWKPPQDTTSCQSTDDAAFKGRSSPRRRWGALPGSKLIPTLVEPPPPRSPRENDSALFSIEPPSSYPEHNRSSSSSDTHALRNVSVQPPSELQQSSKQSTGTSLISKQPARLAGGSGCTCCPCPPLQSPVESCLPGLHQKFVDIYDSNICKEGRLPAGYRSFVEHDDLYLPLPRNFNLASTNGEDLCSSNNSIEFSPQDCCPCDLRLRDTDVTYGDVYLPPSRPCTPAFPLDPCRYPRPSSSPQCGPLRQPQIQCTCSPSIRKVAVDTTQSRCCPPSIRTMYTCSDVMNGVGAKPPGNCFTIDPRCATCECHKPNCPPPSARASCKPACPSSSPLKPAQFINPYLRCAPPPSSPGSTLGDVHEPSFKDFQSTSPRCKDCDCHKPKNCKLSTQVCKFCRGLGYCSEHQTKEIQQSSQSSPKSMKTPKSRYEKECTKIDRTMDTPLMKGSSHEDTFQSDYANPTKTTKVEFESSYVRDFELKSKTLASESQSKGLPLYSYCNRQNIQSKLPTHADCSSCNHGQSCCCDVCSFEVSSHPNKSLYALDGHPPERATMSSGGLMGSSNPGLYAYKSSSQGPKKKRDVISPDKYASRLSSLKPTSNSKVRLPSPRRRIRSMQQQSPCRR